MVEQLTNEQLYIIILTSHGKDDSLWMIHSRKNANLELFVTRHSFKHMNL